MFRSRLAVALALTGTLSVPAAHGGAPSGVWVPTLPLYAYDVDVFDNGRAYALQGGTGTRDVPIMPAIWTSDDSGRTWSSKTLPFWATRVDMATADRGYSIAFEPGTPGFYRTVDGAATWQRMPYRLPPTAVGYSTTVPELNASPDGRTVFAGVTPMYRDREGCFVEPRETPYILSNDGGQTWTSRALAPEGRIEDVEFRTANDGVVVITEMKRGRFYSPDGCGSASGEHSAMSLWTTHDGGRTFTKTFTCAPVVCGAWSVIALTPTGRIVRARQDGMGNTIDLAIEVSDDDGRTWRKTSALPCPATHCAMTEIEFADENVGYASADSIAGSGAIWRTDDGGETWQIEHAVGTRLVAASPNGSALAAGARAVSIRLTNVAGHSRTERS